jgi:hypothetical protein
VSKSLVRRLLADKGFSGKAFAAQLVLSAYLSGHGSMINGNALS